jgi:hypothetical protein
MVLPLHSHHLGPTKGFPCPQHAHLEASEQDVRLPHIEDHLIKDDCCMLLPTWDVAQLQPFENMGTGSMGSTKINQGTMVEPTSPSSKRTV